MNLSVSSTQYVQVPVTAVKNGAAYNPTSDTVQMAFVTGSVTGATWNAASWETVGSTYYALCLVGPNGGVVLTTGSYAVWVKITDNPEIPVLQAGTLNIT